MGIQVDRQLTPVSQSQMVSAISVAWQRLFNNQPNTNQIAMIMAQNALETGNRKTMYNYNIGNITTDGKNYNFYLSGDKTRDKNGNWKPITQKFRSYDALVDGVLDYIKLLSGGHYASAWQHIVQPDPHQFAQTLKDKGYYEADEKDYEKGVNQYYNQFSKDINPKDISTDPNMMPSQQVAQNKPTSSFHGGLEGFWDNLEQTVGPYLQSLMLSIASTDNKSLKQIYKRAHLPSHNFLIQVQSSSDLLSSIEFARVLCAALDEEQITTSAYTHTDGQKSVEIECSIHGPQELARQSIDQMSQALSQEFQLATRKIGGIKIKTTCLPGLKSELSPISPKLATSQYRQFMLKFKDLYGTL